MNDVELHQRLADWCERSGQEVVARKCGVSQPAISQMVNQHVPIGPSVFLAMGFRRVISYETIDKANREK